jgi:sec-independent protein translocase protein TatC
MQNLQNQTNVSSEPSGMTIWDHLRELRKRILYAIYSIGAGFLVAYFFSKELFRFLRQPYDAAFQAVYHTAPQMIQTTLLEGFMVYLKIGVIGGLFLASPFVFLQLWKFIAPGLHPHERRHVIPFVSLATLFFVGGALFGYFLVFPPSFEFFLSVTKGEQINATIRMEEYYELAAWMLLGFGAAFEAPLVVLYLVYFRILSTRHLITHWRGVIVTIFVLSAVITPTPDVGTMLMMALPLMVLYGLTIVASMFFAARRRDRT